MANLSSTTISGTLTEKRGTATVTGTTITVDMATGNYFEANLGFLSGNPATFNVTNLPSASQVGSFIIKILQSSTPRTLDWGTITGTIASGNIKWKVAPTLSTVRDDIDVYSFTTYDSGATWFGSVIGQEFKSVSIYGSRGVFCGGDYLTSGNYQSNPAAAMDSGKMDYVTIDTTGNATTFGALSVARGHTAACSDGQRGVIGGGRVYNDPGPHVEQNVIDYIAIGTPGDATDFGNLTQARTSPASTSSPTRGIWAGGRLQSSATLYNIIDYVSIVTPPTCTDFGDMIGVGGVSALERRMACSDGSRGVIAGGYAPNPTYHEGGIEYISFDHPSNGTNFGNLFDSLTYSAGAGTSDGSRGVFAGGNGKPDQSDIEYITIATPSNGAAFGDLTRDHYLLAGTSNGSRGVFGGGWQDSINPSLPYSSNTIDYITIATTGSATDFGDLTSKRDTLSACSGN